MYRLIIKEKKCFRHCFYDHSMIDGQSLNDPLMGGITI